MKLFKKLSSILFLSALCTSLFAASDSGKPGSFDDAGHAGLKEVLAVDAKVNPKVNEFTVYYVRSDKNYGPWALWMWASPGGDGNDIWPYSQNWNEMDGIGYMKFRLDGSTTGGKKIVSSDGNVGLIVRQKSGWVKDGDGDRIWDTNISNKVVIFSGDQNTYAALPYKPSVTSAELTALDQIQIVLSGRFGLDVDGGISGFSIKTKSGKNIPVASAVNTDNPLKPESNMTKRITINLAEKVNIGDGLIIKNPSFQGDAPVSNIKLAVKIAEESVPSEDDVLGCVYENKAASFSLWAPTSESVSLNLYRNAKASKPDFNVPMTFNAKTGVWSVVFDQADPDGYFYDFTVKNSKGIVNVLDPYARSMAAYDGKGGAGRAAVVNLNSEKAGVQTADYVKLSKREDAVIYEVSVRDFTSSPDSKVKAVPGTYKAFIEKIPYLKSLGVTHIQLLPVLNFYYNDENNKAYESSGNVNANNYNWGYDPHNYFTPEGWYSTNAEDPYSRIRELRELIDECHKAGIGVLLDVVYNHMASTQFLDDIVPGYYFRTDEKGGLKSNSGCGNDTATERKMMKKLVMDSTKYWVENFKADGFRFDLMGLMEASSVEDSYKKCAEINPSVLFEGEGWKMYDGPSGTFGMDQNYMTKTNNVACFNDEFRDMVKAGGMNETGRGLITKRYVDDPVFFSAMTAVPLHNFTADDPGDSLNYLVCHDGLTLHDSIVHNAKLDETKDKKEIISRIKLGNFLVLTSQGLALLHAGQERGRTKPNLKHVENECVGNFVRNSYDSSDNINQIVWNLDSDYQGLCDYTAGLIGIRKEFNAFRLGDPKLVKKNVSLIKTGDASGFVFGIKIKDGNDTFLVLVNARTEEAKINAGVSVENGVILVDSDIASKDGISTPNGVKTSGKSVSLAPLTGAIIRITK